MAGVEISADDLDVLTRFVLKLGGYAEGLFDHHAFGFPKSILRGHVSRVVEDLRSMRVTNGTETLHLRPAGVPEDAIWEDGDDLWNYGQTLRFAAGASMITQRYRHRMTQDNLRNALVAKILHKCQAGILDDLVDQGHYAFMEAKDLYHHCFASMIDPGFDLNSFRRDLALSLKQEQLGMFDLVTSITAAFNRLFHESPNGPDLFYEMERVDDRVILGQALTMFQKHPSLDLSRLKRIAAGFWAPDPDVKWHERLASYAAGATSYNLIDMCFLAEPVSEHELNATLKSWYYYDLVIAHLNHLVGVHKDLRNGIANLALTSMRESDLLGLQTLEGYSPNLTIRDYENQFRRTAEFARRAIMAGRDGFDDPECFYPFITIMIPVVMMGDWIGNRDDMIRMFLDDIAPSIHESTSSGASIVARPVDTVATRAG